jgi:hypothetical protein
MYILLKNTISKYWVRSAAQECESRYMMPSGCSIQYTTRLAVAVCKFGPLD